MANSSDKTPVQAASEASREALQEPGVAEQAAEALDMIQLSALKSISQEVLRLVPERMARRFCLIPTALEQGALIVAAADPTDVVAMDTIIINTGYRVKALRASREDVLAAIERHYGEFADAEQTIQNLLDVEVEEVTETESEDIDTGDLRVRADDAPVVRYVNFLLAHAVEERSSDIHLEPGQHEVRVRFRIDGVLRQVASAHKKLYPAIVSRLKILSNMDIAERRLPQDGRCRIRLGERELDIRVSSMPSVYGEKIVLRILDRSSVTLGLEDLGFDGMELTKFRHALERPHGMILLTGPTGSGKTTSLYAGLNHINTVDRNIITVEDPVEYQLAGINQTQMKTEIGLTFARALRTILRQDPDVIMVGEIRDPETVQIAVRAALTGHLVLSTLHTNDAISAVTRLENMGVEPYLIASSLNLVIAQRLVRRVCKKCKEPTPLEAEDAKLLKLDVGAKLPTVYQGRGCEDCAKTGYRGRVAIYEVFEVTKRIRGLIQEKASLLDIEAAAIEEGMRNIRVAGWAKIAEGLTTVQEVLSATVDSE